MALRDKLRGRVQPHLEPGEQVHAVVPCSSGVNPSAFLFLGALFVLAFNKPWLLVATDRGIVLLRTGKLSTFNPKAVDRRLPAGTRLDLKRGTIWGKSTTVLDKPVYVHRRFWADADQVDAAAGAAAGVPAAVAETAAAVAVAGWYPDPSAPGTQRWWDGTAWTEHVHHG